MRTAFVKTLYKIAKKNNKVVLITGDLGFSIFEEFKKDFPKQYLNAGVAEQNMTGVAAGMAMEDKIPFIYSIVPFVTMRNFEQIRNDLCYQNLNVKLIGVGSGFSYGPYGHTHHGLEDIGILRTLANITIICPGDPIETELAVLSSMKIKTPVYIRLGRAGEPYVYSKKPDFKIGKGIVVTEGKDITIFTTGTMLFRGMEVVRKLKEKKISSRLISMHTIKPIDKDIVINSINSTKAMFSLEEHSIIGGLGSAISEIVAEEGVETKFKRIGVPDRFTKVIGDQEYMRRANNLSVDEIVRTISEHL
jgi:transketolase